jgi:leucyl-tRNA synthetase
VRLSQELSEHGVDAVRLTMVFAGPPEDDIDWKDVSPGGSKRFLARAWRVAGDVTSDPGTDPATGDLALRKTTHRLIAEAEQSLDSFRFNVAVAKAMELVNAARKAIDSGPGPADPAVREAAEAIAVLLSVLGAPYTAEDMWQLLGHQPSVARAGWPAVDPALLVREEVTCVVQIAGKIKAKLQVAPDIAEAELEALALAAPDVVASLGGAAPRRVIVRPPRIVNIVP